MKKEIIAKLESHMAAELSPVDRESLFNDMLDECYSFENVGGPFAHMSPSRVLLECDPVAHRCGVNDYCDGLELVEIGAESYWKANAEEEKEKFLDDLKSALSDLETELEEEQSEEEPDAETVRELQAKIASTLADVEEIEKHSF